MDKEKIRILLKCGLFGLIWVIITIAIAGVIVSYTDFIFKDVLFIEGMALIIIGAMSSIGGDSMGLANLSSAGMNSSTMNYINLEATRKTKELDKGSLKRTIGFGISSIALIVGGLISVIINFII